VRRFTGNYLCWGSRVLIHLVYSEKNMLVYKKKIWEQ